MCSCVEAFSILRACAIIAVGVAGSLPIHGVGTASFLVRDSCGEEVILRIHNCLLCTNATAEETFNLVSVSQLLKTTRSSVQFHAGSSVITLKHPRRKTALTFNLIPDDGLYALDVRPLSPRDGRKETQLSFDFTVDEDLMDGHPSRKVDACVAMSSPSCPPEIRSPSKLGVYYIKILWVGHILSLPLKRVCPGVARFLQSIRGAVVDSSI